MKKTICLFVLSALIVCAAVSSCTKESYDSINTTITGTVLDNESGDALGGVQITLLPGGRNTYSGSDGFFQFNDIEAQQYTIQAQKTGYRTERKTIHPNAGETCVVSINMWKE